MIVAEQDPAGTIEQEQTPQEQPEQRPAWLPDNFKSVEDFAASYKQAQQKISEQGQELAALRQNVEAWEQQALEPEYERQRDRFREAWDDPDQQFEIVAGLAGQLAALGQTIQQQGQARPPAQQAEVTAFVADQTLAARYDDWQSYKSKVAEIVEADPGLLPIDDTTPVEQIVKGLDRIYTIAKAQDVLANQGQPGQQSPVPNDAAKRAAQTMTGQSGRPATLSPDEEAWERIKAARSGGYGDS
jgi:hypothetical protein